MLMIQIRENVGILKKNVAWLESLLSAKSIQLYASAINTYTDHTGKEPVEKSSYVLDYYALVGIDGDVDKVIPIPVLLQLNGEELNEASSWRLVRSLLSSFPTQLGTTWQRNCATGKHADSLNAWVNTHNEACHCTSGQECSEWWYCKDCLQAGCTYEFRCPACEQEWVGTGRAEAPRVPMNFEDPSHQSLHIYDPAFQYQEGFGGIVEEVVI